MQNIIHTMLYCDNQSTRHFAFNPSFHERRVRDQFSCDTREASKEFILSSFHIFLARAC